MVSRICFIVPYCRVSSHHLAVTDNADLIFQQRALDLILPKLAKVIQNLQGFALQQKDLPTLGFTHYQAVSSWPLPPSGGSNIRYHRPSSSPSVSPPLEESLLIPLTLVLFSQGKRAAQWIQELMMDLEDIETVRERLQFRGAQGTTGSQATFLELFNGDADKIRQLNEVKTQKV